MSGRPSDDADIVDFINYQEPAIKRMVSLLAELFDDDGWTEKSAVRSAFHLGVLLNMVTPSDELSHQAITLASIAFPRTTTAGSPLATKRPRRKKRK